MTFLLTDIESSTQHWDETPDEMDAAIARHDQIVAENVARHRGTLHGPRGEGDSHFAVFVRASEAVAAAVDMHLALSRETWPTASPLKVRVALHTCEAEITRGDYYGTDVNRCARLREMAKGGQILVSHATATLAKGQMPRGATLRDLGTHRLRGLRNPERVFELRHPDLPEFDAPARSLVAGNLPLQLTSFVGRKRDVTAVRRLISSERMVTLTGPGGVGKTRLGLHAAEQSVRRFRDGVWLVELAPLTDEKLVVHAIASALEVREEHGLPLLATLAVRLHDKRLLLLLDNCEHVVEVVAAVATELLAACPGLHILAMSREVLGVAGESVFGVPTLDLPAETTTRRLSVARHDAVRLFCERASQTSHRFELTEKNVSAVMRICTRVDGLPLGVELAAAAVRALSVEDIADRLESRRALPSRGRRIADQRHLDLASAIEWSYGLLSDEERRLFRRLSVFAGTFSLEAAEQVCSGDGIEPDAVLGLLTRLVDKSLVTAGEGLGERTRYALLETIASYARSALGESGEEDFVRRVHLAYYTGVAERVGGPEPVASYYPARLKELAEDIDNARAALAWARSNDPGTGVRLAIAFAGYWFLRAVSEGRAALATFLPIAEQTSAARATTLRIAGEFAWREGDYEEAFGLQEEALAIIRTRGDHEVTAGLLASIAFQAATTRDTERSLAALDEAFDVVRRHGAGDVVKAQLTHVKAYATVMFDPAAARPLAEESVERFRALAMPLPLGTALFALSLACIESGDLIAAREAVAENVPIRRDFGDVGGLAVSIEVLAMIAAESGDPEKAVRLAAAAVTLREQASFALPPSQAEQLERHLGPAREKLGHRTADLWAQGRGMSLDEALDYGFGRRPAPRSRRSPHSELTSREVEVVERLSEGLTNGQIAVKLGLSERTVDAHLEHIRNKLGLRTRASIASWFAENAEPAL